MNNVWNYSRHCRRREVSHSKPFPPWQNGDTAFLTMNRINACMEPVGPGKI